MKSIRILSRIALLALAAAAFAGLTARFGGSVRLAGSVRPAEEAAGSARPAEDRHGANADFAHTIPHHLLFLDADLAGTAAHAGPLAAPVRDGRADMTIAVFSNRVRKGGHGFVVGLSASRFRPARTARRWFKDFSSIEIVQEDYGLEISGMRNERHGRRVLRALQQGFPHWHHYKVSQQDYGREQGWMVAISMLPPRPCSSGSYDGD